MSRPLKPCHFCKRPRKIPTHGPPRRMRYGGRFVPVCRSCKLERTSANAMKARLIPGNLPCALCDQPRDDKEATLYTYPKGRERPVCAPCYHKQGRPPSTCDFCGQHAQQANTCEQRHLQNTYVLACPGCATTILPWLQEDSYKGSGFNSPVGFRVRPSSPLADVFPELVG